MVSYSTRTHENPPTAIAAEAATLPRETPAASIVWRGAIALTWREVIRFLRQRNRVVGAVGQPIVFWLLFGVGMRQTFQVPGQSFELYFIPGTLVLILLFTAIFATISIIEDRQEGFLQAVLVAPLPRGALVMGKVAGGSILAVGQALIFLALSWTLGVRLAGPHLLAVLALMTLIAVGLTSLGFCLAWRLDSTQGFHAIMNLLLMPMWLLSGAFFPVPQVTEGTRWSELTLHLVMRCNPVTYSVAGLRQLMFGPNEGSSAAATELWLPSLGTCWLVSLAFALAMLGLATHLARRSTQGDLR